MNSQAALKGGLAILGIVSLVFLAGCGGGTSQASNNQPPPPSGSNPTPTITTISPNSAVAGGAAFTLTVNGTNFVAASVVNVGRTAATTTFVSATKLTAAIPAVAIASAVTAAVTVTNPTPGGTSNAVNFTVTRGGTTNPVTWISLAVAPDSSGKFGKFAYLTNSSLNNVTIYSIDPATGSLAARGSVPAGTSPQSVAVDHSGKFAYVANGGSNDISMYAINSTTGALETLGSVVAGESPISVVIDPSGKFAYVANEGSNDISIFAITSTGTLDPLGPVAAGVVPTSVTVGPFGGFAYVTNADPNGPFEVNTSNGNISTYKVDSTGVLERSGTVAAGLYPRSIAVDPSGKFAYVANCGDFERNQGDIAMYTVDASTGTLTLIGTVGAGSCPLSVVVHPSGKFAYAANTGSDGGPDIEGVSMYTINPNGTLTPMGLINAGYCPSSLAVDPSGKFAYVTNHCDNTISMYTIDLTTGALTLLGTIGTRTGPTTG
jgi:6-phosphogluconolactonase